MNIAAKVKTAGAPERAIRIVANNEKVLLDAPPDYQTIFRGLSSALGKGFLHALIGERGTGKSVMAVGLMGDTFREGRTAVYSTLTRLLMRFKATFNKNSSETELDVMEALSEPDFLVIDEMGRRADTDWEDRLIFELLDSRYQSLKDTLLLTNQTKESFELSLGPSLISRMNETGGLIICNWSSFRTS